MRWAVVVVLCTGAGCSLAREPLAPRFGVDASGIDVGVEPPDATDLDAPLPDAPGLDGGADPGLDAGGTDAPPPDAPPCVPGCAGTVLTTCTAPPEDCAAAGRTCDPGMLRCVAACTEGARSCDAAVNAALVCTAGALVPTFCDGYGCDPATSRCDATCDITGEYTAGTTRFDVCDYGADFENATGTGCNAAANGADRMARVVVTRRSHLSAVLRDDDAAREVDVVLYLWRVCDDDTTQIACGDDVPCGEAPASLGGCLDGNQWRQARIEADLDPGTYYLVADSIDDFARSIDWVCGTVSLSVTLTPR